MKKLKTFEEIINEGAWGHYPLDNDSAADWKWKFGDLIIKELKSKINKSLKIKDESSYKKDYAYYAIGMWEFFKEKLDAKYSFFTDDEISEMDGLTYKCAKTLLDNPKTIESYDDPQIIKTYLENYINKLEEKYKHSKKEENPITFS